MMPLYSAPALRSERRFRGGPGEQFYRAGDGQLYRTADGYAAGLGLPSDTSGEDDSEGGSDSVRSGLESRDGLNDLEDDLLDSTDYDLSGPVALSSSASGLGFGHRGVALADEDFSANLRDDFVRQADTSSASEELAPSPLGRRTSGGALLEDLGDSELSESPGFLADQSPGETDDESRDTESDGVFSNMNSAEDALPLDGLEGEDEEYDDVPNPPPLSSANEERLQAVWTLGNESFNIFLCPITHEVMTDPVVSADGHTYERVAIARWFESSRKSPVTGQTLPHTELVPNQSVRTLLKTLIDMTEDSAPPAASTDRANAPPAEAASQ